MDMNINEVKNFLPHRYPFLLIDRVISFESGKNPVSYTHLTLPTNREV